MLKIKKLCKLIKRQMDALDIHTVYTRSSSGHKRAAVKEKEITFTKIKYTIYFLMCHFGKLWEEQCCHGYSKHNVVHV